MTGICFPAYLETGTGAFRDEIHREVPVVYQTYEQVALLLDQAAHLIVCRHDDPVQVTSCNGGLDACKEEFVLAKFPEIEEVYVYLQALSPSPSENVILKSIILCLGAGELIEVVSAGAVLKVNDSLVLIPALLSLNKALDNDIGISLCRNKLCVSYNTIGFSVGVNRITANDAEPKAQLKSFSFSFSPFWFRNF